MNNSKTLVYCQCMEPECLVIRF